MQQIREVHSLQDVIDFLLQHHPDGTNTAFVRGRTARVIYWMRYAMKVERGKLRCRDYVANGNQACRPSQQVAPASATHAAHDTCTPQAEKNLLDVVAREFLPLCDMTACDWPIRSSTREMERADEAVFGPSGYAHVWRIDASKGSDKGVGFGGWGMGSRSETCRPL